MALERKLAVIPYYSLASGFLSGKYTKDSDFGESARGDGIKKKYWNDRGRRIVSALDKVAHAHQVSMSAVALAWLLEQDSVSAPIASGTKESHLKAFTEAINIVLSTEDIQLFWVKQVSINHIIYKRL